MAKKRPKTYHAIVRGWEPGIYRGHWYNDGIYQLVEGFPGKDHLGFYSLKEAVEWFTERTGSKPDHIEWFENSVQNISWQNIEIQTGNLDISISISDSHKNPKERSEKYEGVEISSQDIGRWGEEYALKALINKFTQKYEGRPEKIEDRYVICKDETIFAEIYWRNINQETNESPDIIVNENGNETYWEVKATTHHNEMDFALTQNEWNLAKSKKERFFILRVCGVGTKRATIYEIANPYELWEKGLLHINGLVKPAKPEIGSSISTIDKFNEREISKPKPIAVKISNSKYVEGIGRRKTSSSRVRIYSNGTGKININGKSGQKYFYRKGDLNKVLAPLYLAGYENQLDISILVKGGGVTGQAEASRLGLARALVKYNPELRKKLRQAGYLTRDARAKERKKPGLKRARKAPQYTKR